MIDALNSFFAQPFVSVLTGAAVGAAITWYFAWLYYRKAGDELKAEAEKLRRATDLIIYILAHPDAHVTPKYDASGNVTGLAVDMSANLSGSGGLRAALQVGNGA